MQAPLISAYLNLKRIKMNLVKHPLPSIDTIKRRAKRLRAGLATSLPISHSRSLELISHQLGFKDWNTLHAAIGDRPASCPLMLGSKVEGKYLGAPIKGEVVGLSVFGEGQKYDVTLHLEEAVDVVKFDSFSSFRQRIRCTIDESGKAYAKTSNGQPHLVLEL